jgi:ATP-dependent RNA helicase SrmB
LLLSELPLHKQLFKAIDKLGFTEATPVQMRTIPAVLAGKDLLVSAKTGSGKTAAFLLPMLDRFLATEAPRTGTRALILLPTRELALQTLKALQSLAGFTPIKGGLIIGGEAFKHQVATLRKNPEVLIATPGRLVEHIERGTPDFKDLEVLVLDEADRMLDMGFAIEMDTIARACNDRRQTLLFSATLKHRGMDNITRLLNEPESIVVDSHRQAHSELAQEMVLADDIKHKEKLVAALIAEEKAHRVIVFCNTRAQCQQLGNVLKYLKLRADFIHGEISQSERKQVMNRFRNGQLEILVATDVAARGLDIEGVELVINFDLAQSGDDHVHRVGRTGRAGHSGKAITLVSATEWNQMSSIERYLKIRLDRRKVEGLVARYKGPKKVKKSGKAAGSKKKKAGAGKSLAGKKPGGKKPSAKRGKPAGVSDGFDVLRKRK